MNLSFYFMLRNWGLCFTTTSPVEITWATFSVTWVVATLILDTIDCCLNPIWLRLVITRVAQGVITTMYIALVTSYSFTLIGPTLGWGERSTPSTTKIDYVPSKVPCFNSRIWDWCVIGGLRVSTFFVQPIVCLKMIGYSLSNFPKTTRDGENPSFSKWNIDALSIGLRGQE